MFLRFCNFTGSFGEIFLVHVLAVVSDCKHPSFRHDISQISTVEAIGELDVGCRFSQSNNKKTLM